MSIFKAQEGQQHEVLSVLAPMIGHVTAAPPNLLLDRGSPNRKRDDYNAKGHRPELA